MKSRLIILALAVLLLISCKLTSGALAEYPKPEPAPTVTLTPEPLPTHTPTKDIRTTVGTWHLRLSPKAEGESIILASGTQLEVLATVGSWYLVQVIGEDLIGYVHQNCCH